MLDVPNYSAINSASGFEYGSQMLIYIMKTLEEIFGDKYLFRMWDAEFAVLLPDTTQNIFTARCVRLRTRVQRRYPGQIRIGYTWSDGIFSARNLVREAQSIMKCETISQTWKKNTLTDIQNGILESETSPIKKYIPYYQPKIDMRDGSLMGAEVLARGIDADGNVIAPARFIESMEKNGGIRELDFFMLENAYRQLSEWKNKGYPSIVVSVNMSRKTLFNPAALASVLAIQSRYPEISPEQIELEITETAGVVEKATLSDTVGHFQQFDIQFSLDDFGSHYANIAIFSNIKFHSVKLDRSLINDLPGNDISKMVVENIANICTNFDILCVAEGVETKQQEQELLKVGCICGQGYYYSRPVPSWKFEEKYFSQPDRSERRIVNE